MIILFKIKSHNSGIHLGMKNLSAFLFFRVWGQLERQMDESERGFFLNSLENCIRAHRVSKWKLLWSWSNSIIFNRYEIYYFTGLFNDGDTYYAFDVGCKQRQSTVCQNVESNFKMRGLCSDSVFDRRMKLTNFLHDGRRILLGPSGRVG